MVSTHYTTHAHTTYTLTPTLHYSAHAHTTYTLTPTLHYSAHAHTTYTLTPTLHYSAHAHTTYTHTHTRHTLNLPLHILPEFPMLSRPESKETTLTFGHDRKTHQLLPDKTLSVGLLLKRKNSLPLNPGSKSLQETKQQRRRQTVPNSLALPNTNKLDSRTVTLL